MPDAPSAEQRLTDLFTAHHRQVIAYVARRTRPVGDHAVAQDVASDVFALVWRRLTAADGDAVGVPHPALPWLLVTARNVLSQRVRDDARRTSREERVVADRALTPTEDELIQPPALVAQVSAALDQLSPDDRELLLLRVWDELSFSEAAQVLGCSVGAARVRWLRARRRFAAALTGPSHDEARPPSGAVPVPLTPAPTGDSR